MVAWVGRDTDTHKLKQQSPDATEGMKGATEGMKGATEGMKGMAEGVTEDMTGVVPSPRLRVA